MYSENLRMKFFNYVQHDFKTWKESIQDTGIKLTQFNVESAYINNYLHTIFT